MTSNKIELEKFDRSNSFGLWKTKMRAVLIRSDLDLPLGGKKNKPENMKDGDWEKLDLKALSTIQLCLSDEVLREVIMENTTEGLWNKLNVLYQTKGVMNRLLLKSRLLGLRFDEGKSIKGHIDEFASIVTDLQNIDVKLEDEDLALTLLCSLPSSFTNFKETLLRGRDGISVEDVKVALLQREQMQKQLVYGGAEGSAMVVKGNRKGGAGSGSRSKKVRCYHCNEKGHFKSQCPELKGKKGDGSSTDVVGEVNVVTEEELVVL